MDDYTPQLDLLLDLETRHEDLLKRLDELDTRVERVLVDWLTDREASLAGLPSG